MSDNDKALERAIELAKAGFDNAQQRIVAIDTKVGITVGFLVVLLPAPLAIVAWLAGLEGDTADWVHSTMRACPIACGLAALGLIGGMVSAFVALLKGFSCLSPRAHKGYDAKNPFADPCQPNVIFPLHKPSGENAFTAHVARLASGIDLSFVVREYQHQLHQVGQILHAKFHDMRVCFWGLRVSLCCYGAMLTEVAWMLFIKMI
jgi:hypothetical protein